LGWWIGEYQGHPIIGNYGAEIGFQSHLGLFLKDGFGVVAMVNVFDPEAGVFHAYDIGNAIADLLLGIQRKPAARAYQPRYEPAACKYPVPDGEKMECGYLTVPEDRGKPNGPTIRLHVTNYKSISAKSAPDPVFIVAGGAGTSGMTYINVIRNMAFGKALRAERDVIFLDQRGTNFSEPALYCPELRVNPADVAGLPLADEVAARAAKIRACHDRLVKEGINLAAYNEMEIAADYADLRVAMGFDQVNLYGMSLGTRLAMIAMREHPEGLRSVILDSVLPPEVNILASDLPGVQAALKTLFAACAADAACNKAYPELEAAFYEVAARLRKAPATVEVTTDKGEHFKATVDDLSFVEYVLDSMFNRAIAPMPASIYAAKNGDYMAVAKARLAPARMRQPGEVGPGGMADAYGHWFSFWCTGDGGAINDDELKAAFGVAGLNPSVRDRSWAIRVAEIHGPCAIWDVRGLNPSVTDQPVTSDIPTLLLEGTFDFFTEPSLVQASAKRLSKSYFFSLPTGHVIAWFSPCGEKLAVNFLRDPSKAPDASCIAEMKAPWVLPK
jgi:pimeloyl-ACP methyl ester carboxylesterase